LATETLNIGPLGDCSITIMVRTSLFPHCRSRLRDTTPVPRNLFKMLADEFRKAIADGKWELPTLPEVVAASGTAAASTPQSTAAVSTLSTVAVSTPCTFRDMAPAAFKGDLKDVVEETEENRVKRRRLRTKSAPPAVANQL